MDEPKNVLGYVYEVYYIGNIKGYSIITENGIALGPFSSPEKQDFVVYVSTLDFIYNFRTDKILERDWRSGFFEPFWEEVHELKKTY